jgi:peroxiredoxin Q/BCP
VFCDKSARSPCCARLISVGDKAPSFSARDQHGDMIRLEDLTAKGRVVLYFYPKDFTRVCTSQACLFRDAHRSWGSVSVVGVSVDSPASHKDFAERHGLTFPLLSDQDRAIAKAYDVVRFFGAFTQRVTFVIDEQGIVRGVFRHELSAEKHIEDVQRCLSTFSPTAPVGDAG